MFSRDREAVLRRAQWLSFNAVFASRFCRSDMAPSMARLALNARVTAVRSGLLHNPSYRFPGRDAAARQNASIEVSVVNMHLGMRCSRVRL